LQQYNLFEEGLKVVKKIPYKFSYIFEDNEKKRSQLMIEDWEVGALYWRVFNEQNDEKAACETVRKKYFDDFAKIKDLYFFLGTTLKFHNVGKNPFMIIGTFHPGKINQQRLDL
jgi:hypothetical protein